MRTRSVVVVVVVIVSHWRREIAVEMLLLLGCEQGANVAVRLKDQMVVLTPAFLVKLHHLHSSIPHQVLNLMVLVGIQLQLTVEPLDESVTGRDPQQAMPIGNGGQRESDHHARDGG